MYCKSVDDEATPRGPEGPYRFQDRSVPLLVIKAWNGTTLVHNLGFVADAAEGKRQLKGLIDGAIKKNGPIVPPRRIKPLQAAYDRGAAFVAKGKIAEAIKEFQSVVKSGADAKLFPDGPPLVSADATERLEEICEAGAAEIDKADELAGGDAKKARAEYQRLLKIYGAIEELKTRIDQAIAAMAAPTDDGVKGKP